MNAEERLAKLKHDIAQISKDRARQEHELESLKFSLAELMETMRSQFNVKSIDEAKVLLNSLHADLVELLKSAEQQLENLRNDS